MDKGWLLGAKARRGFTIVEMLIAIGITAILTTVLFQSLICGTRTAVQTSAQNDVQSLGRIALEKFIDDVRGGFAVVTQVTDPVTGHLYRTAAVSDTGATVEDDRFTIIFAMPTIDSNSGEVIFDTAHQVAAYDAVIWRVLRVNRSASEGVGWRASDYRWFLVRTEIPMVWLTDRTHTTVDRAGNSLSVGGTVYPSGRQAQNLSDDWTALKPCTTDLMLDIPQAAPFVRFKDSNSSTQVYGSPVAVHTGLPATDAGIPPTDVSALVTAVTVPETPTGEKMPVTTTALMDVKLTLLRREAPLYDRKDASPDPRAAMQTLSALDVKLRNKRDWN